ncbi:MAG: class I SAM-dependent methyltransferase [Candidatus Aminicenantia bacterium]
MRRILERLAEERKQKEKGFNQVLEKVKKETKTALTSEKREGLNQLLFQLDQKLKIKTQVAPPGKLKKFFYSLSKLSKFVSEDKEFNRLLIQALTERRNFMEENLIQLNRIISSLIELFQLNQKLMDAKDKEWDALGSNHVGMIFKSMEWRIDKLATEYQDVKILMKKFLLLEDKLDSLLTTLKKRKKPSPEQVEEILEPLRDYKYAGFENRFRGYEEQLIRAQKKYLPYFVNKENVVDLGCGRGEFLQILRDNNIKSYGVDSNDEMIELCLEKGLKCIKGDILEHLSSLRDESLGGIFSAQVIEHLPPKYLMELINKSFFKLKKGCYIVLETVNPTSIFTLVSTYFLDLSHQKPIHPQTLKFLLEITGFEEVEIQFLSPLEKEKLQTLPATDEFSTIINQNIDKLNKLLYAPSDYAAIGKKT